MVESVCVFEDEKYPQFYPISYTRPVFDLVCGMSSLLSKIERLFPDADFCVLCREHLAASYRERHPEILVNSREALGSKPCLFVNGRMLALPDLADWSPQLGEAYVIGGTVAAAFVDEETAAKLCLEGRGPLSTESLDMLRDGREVRTLDTPMLAYVWDIVTRNSKTLKADFEVYGKQPSQGKICDGSHVYGDYPVYVGEGAVVMPGCVLDTTEGPIYLEAGAKVKPPSLIQGPTFVGEKSLIDGAKIREGTTIGPVCKIGGEVEASIFHGFSNKHHEGFIGHAYVGEWVNLGALCTNSDLKNNYKPVEVTLSASMGEISTGETFVGSFVGDHSKLGIGTLLNTGTVIGPCCNLFGGAGVPPRYVPPFSWVGPLPTDMVMHRPDKALETAEIVLDRRKRRLTPADREMLLAVHRDTAEERRLAGIKL